ncbi:M24 family metallopeptidase [Paraburkholderia sabiae]|uniref:Xaa-Pro peptidase family protein n=1 Tax=Paraburkholderia sabiae TaxID=273251 RepID=A0ABU9QLB5_9BURK|nr:Xaa-Pro peptidase family protein [Paraburkholderia sabiae]WJZ79265.1 Xaa-Pro peptidase family protein [Paraburkholderia sabiae]CAD6560764.1 Methionine aminopeptidase 1, mitochondrial [Paraburkholderia sabiae]
MLLNIERLNEMMARNGLDAIVATLPENVTYSSGYWALSQWVRRGPQSYVLIPAAGRGEPSIIAATSLVDQLADQDDVWISKVYRYGFFNVDRTEGVELSALDQRQLDLYSLPDHGTAINALCAAINDCGLGDSVIGIDELGLLPGNFDEIQVRLPNAKVKPALEVFRTVRAVKTPEEVNRLRRAAQIAEQSIASALEIAKPGATERELGLAFHRRTASEGGYPVLGCIGSGPRSAMPNVEPGDRKLQYGDVIRFDVGGRYRHYRADIARIAVLGEPSKQIRQYHHALHIGVLTALEMIRPGVKASAVFDAAVKAVQREGIPHYKRSHVGHGIGIDGYDVPNLTASNDILIEEGMTLCVETPYYELGSWGLQVEDMIVVRRDGVESLMSTNGALTILEP